MRYLDGLTRSNRQRQAAAASATVTLVDRALEILGDEVPETLAVAANLRLAHQRASLAELAALADPPVTKATVSTRLQRLLAKADLRAAELEARA